MIEIKPNQVVTIYTDGSFLHDCKIVGWGAVFLANNEIIEQASGARFGSSPVDAELTAIVYALQMVKKGHAIRVRTDSMAMVSGYPQNHPKDWMCSRFNRLVSERFVTTEWVKGHNNNKYNEMADSLARKAAKAMFKENKERNFYETNFAGVPCVQ